MTDDIDYSKIRKNFNEINPLIRARRNVIEIENKLNHSGGKIVNQEIVNGFTEALRSIEIRILFFSGFIDVNKENFSEYEKIFFNILSAHKLICYEIIKGDER